MGPGEIVGDYRIVKQLGEGGMGMVYLGEHHMLRQKVAIKALHPTLVSNESARDRFVREAEVLARLNHPNIIRLLNFYNLPQGCFIVMEFAEGETLEDMLQKSGLIPPAVCVPAFIQVLRALQYAHRQGVIHRDLKPSNIMMTAEGMAKLLDFGTAKLADAPKLTQQGMTLGTIIYMSKEQLLGKPLDARSDVYSLGVTLYETTTGQLPFYDEEEKKLVLKIAKQEPIPPSQHYPALPKELERIILKSLAKEPEQRWSSAEEMAAALDRFCAAGGVTVPSVPQSPMGLTVETQSKSDPSSPSSKKAPPAPSVTPTAPKTPSAGGGGVLLFFGIGLVVLSAIGGALALALAGSKVPGIVVLAVGVPLGLILTVVGAMTKKKPATTAQVPAGGASKKRVCPTCGRALLENMIACPFCQPPADTGTPAPVPPAGAVPNAGAGSGTPNLFIVDGADKGKLYPLSNGVITMGRAPNNTIVLNDAGVSSNHCSIVHDGVRYIIQDLGARNGVFVNNAKITRQHLNSGDLIVIGTTRLVVNLR
jgi:serine/threonine-protein kinase